MQIMSVIQPDTFINALPNTSIEAHGDGDVHEKFNFLKIEDLRPVNTSQINFQTSLPNFPRVWNLMNECGI